MTGQNKRTMDDLFYPNSHTTANKYNAAAEMKEKGKGGKTIR